MKVSNVNTGTSTTKTCSFKSITADRAVLERFPTQVLKDYMSIAKNLHNSKYIDVWVNYNDKASCRCAVLMKFKDGLTDILKTLFRFPIDNNNEEDNIILRKPVYDLRLGTGSQNKDDFSYHDNDITHTMHFAKGLAKYEKGDELFYINGALNSTYMYIPVNPIAKHLDKIKKRIKETNSIYHEKQGTHHWYNSMMETLIICDELESWMPQLIKTAQYINKADNNNEQTRQNMIKACLNNNYSNINSQCVIDNIGSLVEEEVPTEDIMPVASVVCTIENINDYIIEHATEINNGMIFNKPVTKDGESLLIALAHVMLDENNTDMYIKLVNSMLKMPLIDYNQKDKLGIPAIAHVLNSQNKLLFAAFCNCKELEYEPSLESEFNNITDNEFKALVLNSKIFENKQNTEYKTIFGIPNPAYKKANLLIF